MQSSVCASIKLKACKLNHCKLGTVRARVKGQPVLKDMGGLFEIHSREVRQAGSGATQEGANPNPSSSYLPHLSLSFP